MVLKYSIIKTFYKYINFELAVEPGTWNPEPPICLSLLMKFFSAISLDRIHKFNQAHFSILQVRQADYPSDRV